MTGRLDHLDYLDDIADASAKAQQFVKGMTFDVFAADDKTIFAVIRALEIMGEATKRVPIAVRERYPFLPWRSMAGIRDVVIHEYDRVDLEVIWQTLQEDLPAIRSLIERIVQTERNAEHGEAS